MASKYNDCGASNASYDEPNGSKYWLNCGLDAGGWNPAYVQISDLDIIPDDQAYSAPTFQPCQQYFSQFQSASQSSGIPLIILMSIALQESSCNANVYGQRGEVGLMQITQ